MSMSGLRISSSAAFRPKRGFAPRCSAANGTPFQCSRRRPIATTCRVLRGPSATVAYSTAASTVNRAYGLWISDGRSS